MRFYMGIDPGQSGGIAVISETGEPWAEKMPETERDTWDIFTMWTNQDTSIHALIERVHAMPRQGVSSTFKFGQGYGFLRACLIGARIPFEEITAAQWQGKLHCRTGGNKNVSKQRAQQLFPAIKVTHAVSDCLLLGELCRRINTGETKR